jgi:hypothetical protein
MSLTAREFTILRRTIAVRSTARILLLPLVLFGWAVAAGTIGLGDSPMSALITLGLLAAGFEAIHALHVGAERIGRYLQVFYEADEPGPRWETAAMAVGPALPGGGVDPLFTLVFSGAVATNFLLTVLATPTPPALATLGVLHAGLIVRFFRARLAAARQRTVELESFRALRAEQNRGRVSPIE